MSNVKVGDLARIAGAAKGYRWANGYVVRIAGPCQCANELGKSGVYWKFEERLHAPGECSLGCCADKCLVRIPPNDELDQAPAPPVRVGEPA